MSNLHLISIGNRPPSANNRVIMNAATGQKIGIGGVGAGVTGVGGLSVASSTMSGAGVSGVAMTTLNDPSKGFHNFNITGANGKFSLSILSFFEKGMKVDCNPICFSSNSKPSCQSHHPSWSRHS